MTDLVLCLICRYWIATNGPYCETCAALPTPPKAVAP